MPRTPRIHEFDIIFLNGCLYEDTDSEGDGIWPRTEAGALISALKDCRFAGKIVAYDSDKRVNDGMIAQGAIRKHGLKQKLLRWMRSS